MAQREVLQDDPTADFIRELTKYVQGIIGRLYRDAPVVRKVWLIIARWDSGAESDPAKALRELALESYSIALEHNTVATYSVAYDLMGIAVGHECPPEFGHYYRRPPSILF